MLKGRYNNVHSKDNDLIILAKDTREELEQALQFRVYDAIEETSEKLQLINGKYVTKQEAEQKEQDKINMLTMTALDLINVLKSAGLTSQQIEDYLNANLEVRHQLQYCQNVFCGVVRQLLPLTIGDVIITDDFIVSAFKNKYEAQLNANI